MTEHVPIPPWQAQLPGRWVDARDLRVGNVLYLKSGALAPIEELTLRPVREMVYNFLVEELESYAVGTGVILGGTGWYWCIIILRQKEKFGMRDSEG